MSNSYSTSRRDFLFGGIKPGVDPVALRQWRQSAYWEQYSKNAMACEFEILLNLHQYPQAGNTIAEAFHRLDELEDQMTIFRPHSEISFINQHAAEKSVAVEPQLFDLLLTAAEISKSTGGAFDITAGPLSRLWGFEKRSPLLPPTEAIEETLADVGTRWIELDQTHYSIRFLKPQVQLNLGAIGKGYAIDRMARLLVENGIGDFAIHGGQSSVRCHGSESTEDDEDSESGWWIGLSHPVLPRTRLGMIRLGQQALGTSGTARQGFFHRGQRYGHIIDPRTGWPASHFLSTTVITHSAAKADALATAFFVMNLDEVELFCTNHPDVKAILVVWPDGKPTESDLTDHSGQLLLHTFNLSEEEFLVRSDA